MVFQVRWNRPHMSLRFEHHGALVNPTMGLRTNYTVLWDCHNAILKKQKAEKTNHKGKQTQAKQKPHKTKQNTEQEKKQKQEKPTRQTTNETTRRNTGKVNRASSVGQK